ncbi:flagellar filament capping protein FliD [Quatrionicoccus australiensis]|uniref:flagellar filament capping protein FliD n=1 Tax=Quatrionicoccus australiensis TaxID=138118 RepID=UPI00384BEEAF
MTTLQKKQASYETKISAMGTLRSSLAALQTAATGMKPSTLQSASEKFASYTASVTNTAVASATASTGAVAGSYSLEVSKLAQGQRLTGGVVASSTTSITTNGGTLTLSLGSMNASTGDYEPDSARTYNIALDAGATLADLRDAINDSGSGVTASIINGTNGAQLVLNGPEGNNNVMRLASSVTTDPALVQTNDISGVNYDPDVSGSQDMTQSLAALDAEFTLNGIAATSHSNTVTGVLEGVTLELASTNIGSATTLKITEESTTNLTKALEAFVTAYNSSQTTMSALGAYDPETKVAGNLQGNSTLRYAMGQIRQTVFSATSGNASSSYQTLSNIGVTINSSGKLEIDSSKLNAAIKADSGTVSNLVANVGEAFDTTLTNLMDTDGSLTIATKGLTTTVNDLEKQQTKLQERLDAIETRYRAQFTALDTLVASLSSTGDYLTSFISSLNSSN